MRKLRRLHIDRHIRRIDNACREIHLAPRQRLHDDGIGLDIHRLRLVRIDAEIVQLMRRRAAADADLDPALAQMIQHADFFGEPQRMMRRQHVDQRAEAQALGALRHRGQEHARRRRQIERRRMMLAHVIGAESGAIVELDQLQSVFILFGERIRPVVVLIEYPELHGTTPSTSSVARHDNIRGARRVVRPCYSANLGPANAPADCRRSLWQRFQFRRLAVDDLEHDVARLQLSVRQELRIAEQRALDGLAADRFGNCLAVERFGRLDGAGPDLQRGRAQRRALVRLDAVGFLEGSDKGVLSGMPLNGGRSQK